MKGLSSSRSSSPILPSSSDLGRPHTSAKIDTSSPRRTSKLWHGVRLVGLGFGAACLIRAYTPLGAARLGGDGWSWGAHGRASSCSSGVETWGTNHSEASIKIRVRPAPPVVNHQVRVEAVRDPIRGDSFHPQLAFSRYDLTPPVGESHIDESGAPSTTSLSPSTTPSTTCVEEASHLVQMLPIPDLTGHDPAFFFSYCTTPKRAVTYGPTWTSFLGYYASQQSPTGGVDSMRRPGCLVVDASDGEEVDRMAGREKANEVLDRIGTSCVMRRSSRDGQRYEMRVLGLIADAWNESELRRAEGGPAVEWFVIGDDDSWFVGLNSLKELVVRKNSEDDHLLGGFTGAIDHYRTFGRIAYGGAGMIISRGLFKKMFDMLDVCAERFEPIVWGGDGLISHCAALAKGVSVPEIVEEIAGLSQMDLRGDASGFMSAGTPLLSLHHWASWLDLVPGVSGLDAIALFTAGSNAIGGQNLFRRWTFDGGKTVWTAGYSVMIHETPLSEEDLRRVEHTWDGYIPIVDHRPARMEKLTYYITKVERVSSDISWDAHGVHLV
ncbi:hypothetical protein RQP46_000026 [Phenoliferia psychrophenolica]